MDGDTVTSSDGGTSISAGAYQTSRMSSAKPTGTMSSGATSDDVDMTGDDDRPSGAAAIPEGLHNRKFRE